ncbi:mycothiol-dependent nitroreductase Rv2466c family protein [Nocardioides abyssi]|uniref:DsbA family protein n=1 Tax=Nocardioides abyssi TaxID=3058370 RepID=A0ABT8ENM9_9ACTN|nr:DsbA family protein [Nocardioides abyssi]MDN4159747.1 DsbA family protein [Nocardioides abyssi]
MTADVRFWFDPVCPFAWLTSEWVREVQRQRDLAVEWRFISLRLLNKDVDYDAQFPPDYEAGHTAGLRLLRVCAQVRDDHGPDAVARLYEALGRRIHDAEPTDREVRGTAAFLEPVLEEVGLPAALVGALDDAGRDAQLQAETDEALAITGKDVGTPIIAVADGPGFFGPVISRLPAPEDAARLWDHVVGLASFPGFAELKRSLRERPQLRSFGVEPAAAAPEVVEEDWHGGSRRQHR